MSRKVAENDGARLAALELKSAVDALAKAVNKVLDEGIPDRTYNTCMDAYDKLHCAERVLRDKLYAYPG